MSQSAIPSRARPLPFRARAACLGLLLALLLAGCATASRPGPGQRHEFTRPQMGVPFRLVLYARDAASASTAAEAAFARVAQLNATLSDYDPDSELSRLGQASGTGAWVPVSADLWRMLAAGQRLSRETEGAFDVTVGPLVNLWRKARRERRLPEDRLLAEARARSGWRQLELDPRRQAARLNVPDMRLDLGGIAKGYAVDEALRVLRAHGIRAALVSGGGDLAVSAAPPGTPGWRIQLEGGEEGGAAEFVRLRHAALATSGDLFQFVEVGGVRYSHIVDPRTGLGLTNRSLVTVIARDGRTADSLATALSVQGPERGRGLLLAARAEARVMVWHGGQPAVWMTPGFGRWRERAPPRP